MAKEKLLQPMPLGYPGAAKDIQSVAAPLFAAAALSLAGVVAGAAGKVFGWPGPTLLILVVSALALISGIQINHYARQFLYTRADILDWYGVDPNRQIFLYEELCENQGEDFGKWTVLHNRAIGCFNVGTIGLWLGVAAALIPPDNATQGLWRQIAAGIVVCAATANAVITYQLRNRNRQLFRERSPRHRAARQKDGAVQLEDKP